MKKYLFILLLGGLLTSCGEYLTDAIIAQYGTKVFEANFDDVWEATKGVLATHGYAIAYENKEKGILNTDLKLIRAQAQGNAHSAQASGIYRQYLVKIKPISDNKTQVTLTPKIFNGNNDISADKIWVIKGPNGEIQLWQKIFNDLKALL